MLTASVRLSESGHFPGMSNVPHQGVSAVSAITIRLMMMPLASGMPGCQAKPSRLHVAAM